MRLILCLLLPLFFVSCSDLERVERRNAEGVVIERYSRTKTDSLREGAYEAFDETGTIAERAQYAAGVLDGKRQLFHPNGQIQYEESHSEGAYEGPYRGYYPDGTLELEGQYVADEAIGTWTTYYPNGQKKEEVTFADNHENGPFTEWYSNGTKKAEGTYLNGDNEQGELVLYNLDGDIEKRMHCEAGACRTVWRAETVSQNAE